MIILLGSGNQKKVAILRSALAQLFGASLDIKPYAVPSGISEQPLDLVTTIRGSRNRARRAAADHGKDYDLSFGLEGGLQLIEGTYHLVAAVSILDPSGYLVTGESLPQRLPRAVSDAVLSGANLGEAIREYAARLDTDAKEKSRAEDLIERRSVFRAAIAAAWKQRLEEEA